MGTLMQDIRYGVRMLLKSRAFTVVAILSLALGIGANTTIFTLVNTILLQSLPVAEPARLMSVYGTDEKNKGNQLDFAPISYPNYLDYRDQNDVFSGLLIFGGAAMSLSGTGEAEQLNGLIVSGNYFDVLGVKAKQGRTFLPEEDATPGSHPVIVISYGLWQRRFGGDPSIVGKQVTLNNQSFTVIGVAPENFRGTFAIGGADFWVPMAMHDQVLTGIFKEWFTERRALLFNIIGRLKPGVTIEQAQAAMQTIGRRLEQEYPKANEKRNVMLVSLPESTINPNQRGLFVRAGGLLSAVVGLVLLIACANVANLMLARATARRKEIAIRAALGAGRLRIIRQLLTESILLSVLGGGLGLFLAYWSLDLLWAYRPPFFDQNALSLDLDRRVLVFTILLSVLTGIIFGLAPALQSTRTDLVSELKEKTGQPNQTRRRFSLRNMLVVAQVALSLVALIGAGLFLRSLRNAQQINPGFETKKLLVMSFDLGAQGYNEARGLEFNRQAQARVEAIPGVRSAALATSAPLNAGFMRSVFIEGQEPAPGGRGILTLVNTVGMKYFETVGIPVLKGRDFGATDQENSVKVVVVNEAFARRFWPNDDAVGKRFKFFGDEFLTEVVGVVRNSDSINLGEEPRPLAYLPLAQHYAGNLTLHVRTQGDPETVLATVRREVQALDPNLPLVAVSGISEVLDQVLWAPRMGAALLATFGLLALGLAAVGIYGVLGYSVSQRTHEIGLRMALGAQRSDVLRMVVGQGMTLTLIGVGVGIVAAFLVTRFMESLLYGVTATDPVTFAAVSLVLLAVALLACFIPARRATRVDPMIALRHE
ncbi:MAG TPA: ABC transporter permease [Pyrinomonadaceae bacterium]|jgi:predicted permease|nr:ABC transporter permease [Pyrinomonadaceae bacterium]